MSKLITASKTRQEDSVIYNRTNKDMGSGETFTRISNSILRDDRLDALDQWIMTTILSNNDSFLPRKTVIQKRSGFGRQRFNRSWSKLEELGYIEMSKFNTSKGSVYHYVINEGACKPLNTPTVSKPTVGNDTLKNKQYKEQTNIKSTSDFAEGENAQPLPTYISFPHLRSDVRELYIHILNANKGLGVDISTWSPYKHDEAAMIDLIDNSSHGLDGLQEIVARLEDRSGLNYISVSLLYKEVYGESYINVYEKCV